ncbi:MAG: hypothetical protein HXX13_13810 [Bacteroidetes bacterium]|nr:hypothetical protein [Bacteroidota bacterium]
MKKVVLFAFSVLLAFSAFSQKGVFDNAFYIKAGYAFPGGNLKDMEVVTAGAQFEVGTIFYINALKLPENMKLGIDATYISISGYANRKQAMNENKTDSYFRAGAKIGPCFSYNFAGNWIGDVFVKLYPHSFIMGEHKYNEYSAANQTKLGASMGLNIRYKALVVGYEFISGKYDFTHPESAGDMILDKNVSIKIPTSILSIGVKF